MDSEKSIGVISEEYFPAPNLVTHSGTVNEALNLNGYAPMGNMRLKTKTVIYNVAGLHPIKDDEYWVIQRVLSARHQNRGHIREDGEIVGNSYRHILNLKTTLEDARMRQEAVRELTHKPRVFRTLGNLVHEMGLYLYQGKAAGGALCQICDLTPERVKNLVEQTKRLEETDSLAFQRAADWAKGLQGDTYFSELVKKSRTIFDARLFAVFSERFGDVRYGILKPGVKPEDAFDLLDRQASRYGYIKQDKKGRVREVRKEVVKYKIPFDKKAIKDAIGHARQRMDVQNEIVSIMMAYPMFLAFAQFRHYLDGAMLHRDMRNAGYNCVFPEISDQPHELIAEQVLPVRLALENLISIEQGRRILNSPLCANDFCFKEHERVIQVEGPNHRGKSEAWRTVHLLTALTNSGYSVPAQYARMGVARSNFIACKSAPGTGGSEFQRGTQVMIEGLQRVFPGDRIVLDELGDSTNRHTACSLGERLLPELINNGNQIFITSHHDALTEYIKRELHGISLTPDASARGVRKYRLVRSKGQVDFKPEETLDEMQITRAGFRGALRTRENRFPVDEKGDDDFAEGEYEGKRPRKPQRKRAHRGDADYPF